MQLSKIIEKTWEVDSRLISLGLNKSDLIEVVRASELGRNNSTDNDPANAAGWFGYCFGTRALRDIFCQQGWNVDRKDGIESIFNETLNIKIVYQNVDSATDTRIPKARSKKGAGSERAIENNNLPLFPDYKVDSPPSSEGVEIWYLCVYSNGSYVHAELSIPTSLIDGQFSDFKERIFLIKEGEWEDFPISDQDNEDDQDFEITVVRK